MLSLPLWLRIQLQDAWVWLARTSMHAIQSVVRACELPQHLISSVYQFPCPLIRELQLRGALVL